MQISYDVTNLRPEVCGFTGVFTNFAPKIHYKTNCKQSTVYLKYILISAATCQLLCDVTINLHAAFHHNNLAFFNY